MIGLSAMEGNVDMFLGDHADPGDVDLTSVDELGIGAAKSGAPLPHDGRLQQLGQQPGVQG